MKGYARGVMCGARAVIKCPLATCRTARVVPWHVAAAFCRAGMSMEAMNSLMMLSDMRLASAILPVFNAPQWAQITCQFRYRNRRRYALPNMPWEALNHQRHATERRPKHKPVVRAVPLARDGLSCWRLLPR